MIEVKVQRNGRRWRLEFSGHAGFAEKGKDIVCAAVSALYEVLRTELEEQKGEQFCLMGEGNTLGALIEPVVQTLERLAQEYPKQVCVTAELPQLQRFADEGAAALGTEGAEAAAEPGGSEPDHDPEQQEPRKVEPKADADLRPVPTEFDERLEQEVLRRMEAQQAEREAAREQLRQQAQKARSFAQMSRLVQEVRTAQERYPDMELAGELENPEFRKLLHAGVSVQNAYELCHREALLEGAMQAAAAAVAERLIFAASTRPTENGTPGLGAARPHPDVGRLTRDQRRALIHRARNGERIEL